MLRRLLIGTSLIKQPALIIGTFISRRRVLWSGHAMLKTVFVLLTVSSCFASDVIELDDKNFDSTVKSSKFIVVEFYTNW